ncbi:MAG TPA: hypothetical protein VET84_03965 [Stellaceae bacterium]|jgi:hypothetical protein|nr:hypothetical protein [Stellaceae bacterium]
MSRDPMVEQERRMMHRLLRLFRLERDGRLERWPIGFVFALIARRRQYIDELMSLDAERRRRGAAADRGLDEAAQALAREIGDALPTVEVRADQLRSDVKAVRGEGMNSGMKGFSSGRVLGRG